MKAALASLSISIVSVNAANSAITELEYRVEVSLGDPTGRKKRLKKYLRETEESPGCTVGVGS